MALTLNSNYQNVGFDYVLDGVRDLLISEFTYGKIYISPELKFNDPFQIKLWVSESATEDYNAISWSKEYTVDIDLYMIDSNHDENAYKQLYQDTERIYQVLFNNAHKEITVAGNSLQWLNGKTETIGINDFDGEEGEVDGLLKSSLSFTCNVHAGEISNYSTRSLDFDGSDEYVDLGSQDGDLRLSGSDGTISVWIKIADVSAGDISKRIVDKSDGGAAANGYSFFLNTDGSVEGWISGAQRVTTSTGIVADNTWVHLAWNWDGTNHKLYVNGSLSATASDSTRPPSNTTNMRIGSWNHSTGREFSGNIDEVAIWNTALTQSAITELYNSGKPKDIRIGNFRHLFDSSCVAYWRMGDGTLDEYPFITEARGTVGSELVVDGSSNWVGDFDVSGDISSWASTDSGELAISHDSSNNAIQLTGGSASSGKWAYYTATVEVGESYAVSVKMISRNDSGTVPNLRVGRTICGTVYFNTYWTSFIEQSTIFTASTNTTCIIAIGVNGNDNNAGFDNVSLKKVSEKTGLMTNMVAGNIEEDTP